MSAQFEIGGWRLIVGNFILFKVSFGWIISHKIWESYAWSKLSWLFLQNTNLATYEFWWILSNPWWIMINPWSNYEISFKMRMLIKKSLSLTIYRSQLTFALAQSIFGPLEQLTDQTSSARLEIWHGWTWEHIRTLGRTWGHLDSRILMQHKTLIWDWLP